MMTSAPEPLPVSDFDPAPDPTGRRGGTRSRAARAAWVTLAVSMPFWALTVGVLAGYGPLLAVDRDVATAFHDAVLPRPGLASLLKVLSIVTDPSSFRVVALVIAAVLWVRGRRRRLVAWLVITMTVGGLLGMVLKVVVGRPRPVFDVPVATTDGYSFPSGHALNAMLFAACLIVLVHPVRRGIARAGAWAAAVVIAVVTGLDRLGLGVHYLSDVLGGWIVALATVTATTIAFATWERDRRGPHPSGR